MTTAAADDATFTHLDDATRALVRLSAILSAGSEHDVRGALHKAASVTPYEWIEELLLQTYLFAGFPRALNGMREWRRLVPSATSGSGEVSPSMETPELRRAAGVATCARVYGAMYERLRVNIRELHPLLDDWMIEEGYGKVLSRPGLDLARRELCIVAACAATGQDRQLQSHLHGARNVGVAARVLTELFDALHGVIADSLHARANRLWQRIAHDIH